MSRTCTEAKTCKRCGESKPTDDFYRQGKYLHPFCKPCTREDARLRREVARGGPPPSRTERFWSKVVKQPNGCWAWTGARTKDGYGRFWDDDKFFLAHRWIYQQVNGPIDSDLTLDHQCHNSDSSCSGREGACPHRACVNPDHLEPALLGVNTLRGRGPSAVNARKTHCINGHEFTEENTRLEGKNRRCRQCRRTPGYVPRGERIACPQGHAYDEANTYVDKTGARHCRTCRRERARRRRGA